MPITKITSLLVSLTFAALAALWLAHLAHSDFGIAPRTIRADALLSALLVFGLLLIGLFSRSFGHRG